MTMNRNTRGALLAACLVIAWSPSVVHAQDDDLGVTMRMVTDDAEMTDQVVREIELPESEPMTVPDETLTPAAENARDVATEVRQQGRRVGQQISDQAREQRDALDLPSPASGRPDPLDSVKDGLDQVGDGVNQGVDQVGDILDGVGDGTLGETVDQVGDTVGDTVDQVGDTLGGGSSD